MKWQGTIQAVHGLGEACLLERDITNPHAPAVAAARGVPPAPGLQPCLILPRRCVSRRARALEELVKWQGTISIHGLGEGCLLECA